MMAMRLFDRLTNLAPARYRLAMTREAASAVPLQSGALPWRLKGRKKAEVLLVTGRRSGRWTIPKGWPMPGKSLAESAAQEAFEEAGIEGKLGEAPIGTFRHVKQHLLFGEMEVDILVHALAVKRELRDWPEKGERSRKWFALDVAATRVDSSELGGLILEFGKSLKKSLA
jgi:8-oxo-dGTP pyrophosphatase MutT (NUDIX family)